MPRTAKADRRAPGKSSGKDPAQGILDVAEQLAQTRGYNGFSYADIAERLGVTKASLHYHFASKAELGRALIARYHVAFAKALDAIEQQERDPAERLRRYVALYDAVMSDDRMCLCGMLAAEYATLPRPMQEQLKLFFDANERWLTAVLEAGSRAGSFGFKEAPRERAQVLLGALEGAMLVARSYGDPQRFRSSAQHVLADLGKVEQLQQRKAKAGRTG
jgi:TetR/AcrR family transcriptional regulator, transcriptional repressor for nem operon